MMNLTTHPKHTVFEADVPTHPSHYCRTNLSYLTLDTYSYNDLSPRVSVRSGGGGEYVIFKLNVNALNYFVIIRRALETLTAKNITCAPDLNYHPFNVTALFNTRVNTSLLNNFVNLRLTYLRKRNFNIFNDMNIASSALRRGR